MTRQDWMAPLTVRTANVLLDAGCLERDHVLSASDEWILRLRNAGRRVLDELRARGLRPDSCSTEGCQLPVGHGGSHVTFESRYAANRRLPSVPFARLAPRQVVGRSGGVRADLRVEYVPGSLDPDGTPRPILLTVGAGGPGRPEVTQPRIAVTLSVAEALGLAEELRLRLLEAGPC